MDLRPLIGLFGVIVAALTADFNDQVISISLPDIQGGLGLSHDQGTWFSSLYATGQVLGMTFSPWFAVTFSLRRWLLFAITLCCVSTICMPLTSTLTLLYGLRFLQGVSGGLIIPVLLVVGLRVLAPPIRLYGLAAYALTATFGPNMSTSLAALWTGLDYWSLAFYEALPLCAVAAAMVWFGVQQDAPQYQRFRQFDLLGGVLAVLGFGALCTMLEQGDRYDWFNSPFICVLALTSAVALPLFVLNELEQDLPLFGFFLLKRRNFAYAMTALFTFLLLSLSSSTLPVMFLREIAGFRPVQLHEVTLLIALGQLIMLPVMALVLDVAWVDARVVSFIGAGCVLAACLGDVFLSSAWQGGGFFIWQSLQAVGAPMIIMPLLMMATNAIAKPEEAPLASALVNTCRGLAEPVGVWLLELIMRWRGSLHYNRIVDQAGQQRFAVLQTQGVLPDDPAPLLSNGLPRAPGALRLFAAAVREQALVLTLADSFLVIAGLAAMLLVVLLILPVRTYPPRIALAKH